MTLVIIVTAVVLFFLLVIFHEFGHMIAAKAVGIWVQEFSVGMGPLVFSRKGKSGDTTYSVRLLPLGGFTRMAGMEEDLDNPRGYNRRSVPQRLLVIASGSLMNFVLAIVFYALAFLIIGVPSNSTVVGNVLPEYPAYESGLVSGDRITAVNGSPVDNWSELVNVIQKHPGEELSLTILRDKQTHTLLVTPREDSQTKAGMIGIEQSMIRYNPFASLWYAVRQSALMLYLILVSLGQMFAGQVPVDLVGPVGIVQMVGQAARFGVANVLGFAAFISVNLGLINLLPIPALDGSRLIFLLVEGFRGRPVDPKKENFVHLIGFSLLMLVFLILTYRDILRIFGQGHG